MEKQEKKQIVPKQRKPSSYVIEGFISLAINIVISLIAGVLDVYSRGRDFAANPGFIFGDAMFVDGILCICFWGLLWLASQGTFDIFVYGVRKFLVLIFRIHPEHSNLPETFYDYQQLKSGKKNTIFWLFLIVSSLFFAIGIIVSLVYQ